MMFRKNEKIQKIKNEDMLYDFLSGIYHLNAIQYQPADDFLSRPYYTVEQRWYRLLDPSVRQDLLEFLRSNSIVYGVDKFRDIMYYAYPEGGV